MLVQPPAGAHGVPAHNAFQVARVAEPDVQVDRKSSHRTIRLGARHEFRHVGVLGDESERLLPVGLSPGRFPRIAIRAGLDWLSGQHREAGAAHVRAVVGLWQAKYPVRAGRRVTREWRATERVWLEYEIWLCLPSVVLLVVHGAVDTAAPPDAVHRSAHVRP